MNTSEIIYFTFKLAHTEQTKVYGVNPNITIANFIEKIKRQAYNDFNIYKEYDIEIVETGQYDNINGHNPEDAPSLIHEFNTSLREKYGNTRYNVSFYIRVITNL